MAFKIDLSPKQKKIINIVVDVFVTIVLAFALMLAICSISSKARGFDQYTEIFGRAYLAVESDSMKGEGKDNFEKGDLIAIKTVSAEGARKFKVGDIITFKTKQIADNGKTVLNTHRIIEVNGEEGMASSYRTKGDANDAADWYPVLLSDVVGVYQGKASGIGRMFLFMGTSAGFFTCIVLPSLLVVAYFAFNLFMVIRKEKKLQMAGEELAREEERERIRRELLAEMQAAAQPAADSEKTPREAPETDVAPEDTTAKSEESEPVETTPSDGDKK